MSICIYVFKTVLAQLDLQIVEDFNKVTWFLQTMKVVKISFLFKLKLLVKQNI